MLAMVMFTSTYKKVLQLSMNRYPGSLGHINMFNCHGLDGNPVNFKFLKSVLKL